MSLSSLDPCFIFSRNKVPIGVHFYGEFYRGMLNVEGSRKDATDRTGTSCQLKLRLGSTKLSVFHSKKSDVMNFFREL